MKRQHEGSPMDLANMRANGVRSLSVSCRACHRSVRFNVDAYRDIVPVVAFGPRMVCTRCGMMGRTCGRIGRSGRLSSGRRTSARLSFDAVIRLYPP
jgi:hypothetical protein